MGTKMVAWGCCRKETAVSLVMGSGTIGLLPPLPKRFLDSRFMGPSFMGTGFMRVGV